MKRRTLDAHVGPTAGEGVFLYKVELAVVFIDIVLFHALGQAADDKEMVARGVHTPRAMKYLLHFMLGKQFQCLLIVDVHPRVGVAFGIVKIAQIHRHVDPAVLVAEVAVVIGHGNGLLDIAFPIRLHQFRRERPVDGIPLVGADALKVPGVIALTNDGRERRRGGCEAA